MLVSNHHSEYHLIFIEDDCKSWHDCESAQKLLRVNASSIDTPSVIGPRRRHSRVHSELLAYFFQLFSITLDVLTLEP